MQIDQPIADPAGEYQLIFNELFEVGLDIVGVASLTGVQRAEMHAIINERLNALRASYGMLVPALQHPTVEISLPDCARPRGKVIGEIDREGVMFFSPEGCFEYDRVVQKMRAITDPREVKWLATYLEERV